MAVKVSKHTPYKYVFNIITVITVYEAKWYIKFDLNFTSSLFADPLVPNNVKVSKSSLKKQTSNNKLFKILKKNLNIGHMFM